MVQILVISAAYKRFYSFCNTILQVIKNRARGLKGVSVHEWRVTQEQLF